jgi:hypothetical protein
VPERGRRASPKRARRLSGGMSIRRASITWLCAMLPRRTILSTDTTTFYSAPDGKRSAAASGSYPVVQKPSCSCPKARVAGPIVMTPWDAMHRRPSCTRGLHLDSPVCLGARAAVLRSHEQEQNRPRTTGAPGLTKFGIRTDARSRSTRFSIARRRQTQRPSM